MISKEQSPKSDKRRPKREFTLADKQRFYNLWKASGLTKTRFCQEQGLAISVFIKWCKILTENPKNIKNHWIPIVAKEKILRTKELNNPENQGLNPIKTLLILLLLIQCLRALLDAINIIR